MQSNFSNGKSNEISFYVKTNENKYIHLLRPIHILHHVISIFCAIL